MNNEKQSNIEENSNNNNVAKEIDYVRTVGFVESLSSILLFFVAMPMKYFLNMPKAVSLVGSVHGVLWLIFVVAVVYAFLKGKINTKWAFILGVLSILPIGPILADKYFLKEYYTQK